MCRDEPRDRLTPSAVEEPGSLTRGADRLAACGLVSRDRIRRHETRRGPRSLTRTTQDIAPTEAGERSTGSRPRSSMG